MAKKILLTFLLVVLMTGFVGIKGAFAAPCVPGISLAPSITNVVVSPATWQFEGPKFFVEIRVGTGTQSVAWVNFSLPGVGAWGPVEDFICGTSHTIRLGSLIPGTYSYTVSAAAGIGEAASTREGTFTIPSALEMTNLTQTTPEPMGGGLSRITISLTTNANSVASIVYTLPGVGSWGPNENPALKDTVLRTEHSFTIGSLVPGIYNYTVYAAYLAGVGQPISGTGDFTVTSTATPTPSPTPIFSPPQAICGAVNQNCCNITGPGAGTCNTGLVCVTKPPLGAVCCPSGNYWDSSSNSCQPQVANNTISFASIANGVANINFTSVPAPVAAPAPFDGYKMMVATISSCSTITKAQFLENHCGLDPQNPVAGNNWAYCTNNMSSPLSWKFLSYGKKKAYATFYNASDGWSNVVSSGETFYLQPAGWDGNFGSVTDANRFFNNNCDATIDGVDYVFWLMGGGHY